ncbi:MAG: hypothetical protein OEM03_02520 [Chromatiales bacterium]|nr:hypothetical protein [Chromatiales bacterium]
MYEQGFSPEAEVSRAMEKVLTVERSTSSAVKAAGESADTVRRAATEQAQRIILRAERRIITSHRNVDIQLREEIARIQAEASLTVDNYPDLKLSDEELDKLSRETAQWLTSDVTF